MKELKTRKGADDLMQKSGLPISTYPSVTKLLWLLKNEPKVKEAYEKGTLAFGTIDAWLVYKLNGHEKRVFVSDPTNASRTYFMNIHTLKYDPELIAFFGDEEFDLSRIHMPDIVKSSCDKAYGTIGSGVLSGFKLAGCLGDQSAALVGQKGFDAGSAKNT